MSKWPTPSKTSTLNESAAAVALQLLAPDSVCASLFGEGIFSHRFVKESVGMLEEMFASLVVLFFIVPEKEVISVVASSV